MCCVELCLHKVSCTIAVHPYHLKLKSAFGTSHSSTTTRTNALFQVVVHENYVHSDICSGVGESGLPPKKPHCYLADYADVEHYFQRYAHTLHYFLQEYSVINNVSFSFSPKTKQGLVSKSESEKHGLPTKRLTRFSDALPFFIQSLPLEFRRNAERKLKLAMEVMCSSSAKNDSPLSAFVLLILCLHALRFHPDNCSETAPCKSGLEVALLDCLGTLLKLPVHELLGINFDPTTSFCPFYTAALHDSLEATLQSAEFGLQQTSYLKIKIDGNVSKCQLLLHKLYSLYSSLHTHPQGKKWCIDANASWSANTALDMLSVLCQYKDLIYCVGLVYQECCQRQSESL